MYRNTRLQYIIGSAPKMKFRALDYDKYWRTRPPAGVHKRFGIIEKLIEPKASVLDIGCGRGELLYYLSELKEIQGFGLDISGEAINQARIRGLNAEVKDILEWNPDTVYDYIIMTEVLEHITKPEEIMLKIKPYIRKGLIISIPNTGFYKDRLRLLFGHFPVQWVYHPSEHVRYWTMADFKAWLEELGFSLISAQASIGTRLLRQYLPGLFGAQIVFFCKKSGKAE